MNLEWINAFGAMAGSFAWWITRKTARRAVLVGASPVLQGRLESFLSSVTFRSSGSGPGGPKDPPEAIAPIEADVSAGSGPASPEDLSQADAPAVANVAAASGTGSPADPLASTEAAALGVAGSGTGDPKDPPRNT